MLKYCALNNFVCFLQVLRETKQEAEILHPVQKEDCPLHDDRCPQEGQRRLPHRQLRSHLPGKDARGGVQPTRGGSQPFIRAF